MDKLDILEGKQFKLLMVISILSVTMGVLIGTIILKALNIIELLTV